MAEINFNATGFSSLKAQIREATLEYQALLQNIEATPEALKAAAAKVADLKDSIDDANDAVQALTGAGKFQAFTKGLSSVAGGFTAIQGAITLAGGDAKEFEQTMLKLQGALALTQGLAALEDLPNAFKNIKTAGVGAFKAIKAAIGSTGIGLLVIALGTIVAFWDDIMGAVSGVTAEQKVLNKATEDNLAIQTEQLATLNATDNILKEQGLTERDIAKLKQKQTEETIKAAEANIANLKVTEKKQIEAAQRNKDILQGIIRFLTLPLTALLMTVDSIGKALGQDFGLEEGFSGGLAKLVFDPEEVKTEGDKAIKEAEKALLTLKNQKAGYANQIRDIDKKAADDAQKTADDAADKKKKEQEKALEDEKKSFESNYKELLAAQKKFLEDQEKLRKDTAKALALTEKEKQSLELQELKEHYDGLIAEADRLGKDTTNLYEAKFLALGMRNAEFITKEKTDLDKATADKLAKEKAYRQSLEDLVFNSAFALIGDLKALNDNYDRDNEEAAKKAFERGKSLAIAETIITTYLAASKAYASQFVPPEPTSPVRGGIAAGVAVASGLARLAVITSTQFKSSGSDKTTPGGKAEATPSTYADGGLLMGNSHNMGGIKTAMGELEGGEFVINRRSTANFMPLLEAINTLGNTRGPEVAQNIQTPIIKTYVVATDVTSQQEANVKLNALARL